MEHKIETLDENNAATDPRIQFSGRIDRLSIASAVIGGAGFWLLAVLSLGLTRDGATFAAAWLPNACAVAFLLRARLSNEVPFLTAIVLASVLSYAFDGGENAAALIYSLASLVGVATIVWVTRRTCGPRPDMAETAHLAWFVWAGGVIGPLISASVAIFALLPSRASLWDSALSWFLAQSMAMVLIVPTVLLIVDALRSDARPARAILAERAVLLILSLLAVFLVFDQTMLPLLFVVPPITLLHAFRLGSLGTAIFVSLAAVIAVATTSQGQEGIARLATNKIGRELVQRN